MPKAKPIDITANFKDALAANTKALNTNSQALFEIKQALEMMKTSQNLLPALCHALDRLQAEFTALRLHIKPPKKAARR